MAAIETHLRGEGGANRQRLVELIDSSDLENDLRSEVHTLRRYRYFGVHGEAPYSDCQVLIKRDDEELESMARRSVVALRRTIYTNPWI